MENHEPAETIERVGNLERIIVIQQGLIDRLYVAADAQQKIVEVLADIVAPGAIKKKAAIPASTLN